MTPADSNSPETRTHPPVAVESGDDPDDLLLVSLCRQWEAARRDGRPASPADLCAGRPDLLPDLLRAIDVLQMMDGGATATLPAEPADAAPPRLPGYGLLTEVGRGGMGVVYSARHLALNRVVALKLISDAGASAPRRLVRFRQEAEAVARLQHPNIVQIFETGVIDGRPFIALEFVDGGNLRQRTAGVPQPPRDAARLVETVARAVHHAHEHRIVHRDIKPANILVTAAGVPKVTDFGLARALDADGGLTLTADLLGTPAYAAPEQIHNRPADIGPATDVYGLGATLYELLAGRPPFETGSLPELLRQVTDQEPTALRRLRPECPRDLETICQKCLEKSPARRYPSALALAEDLRRFLADELILARPVGPMGRAGRWAKRNPAVAALVATIGLVLTAAAVVGAVLSSSLAIALRDAKQDRDRAVKAEAEGQRKLFAAYVSEANAIRASGQPGQRFLALDKIREALALGAKIELSSADRLAARNAACAALCQPDMCPGPDWDADAPAEGVPPVTVARARALRFRPPGNTVPVPVKTVSPTGRFVIVAPRTWAAGAENPYEVWRLDGTEPARVFADAGGMYQFAVAFSPDERKLAIGRQDGTITVYGTADGRVLTGFSAGVTQLGPLVWHPDGEKLAVIAGGEAIAEEQQRVWDTAASPPVVWTTVRHALAAGHVAFHPSGRVLATASSADGFLRLWDLPSGRPLAGWRSRSGFYGGRIVFNRDGDLIAGNDWNAIQNLWDAGTGRELAQLVHGGGDHLFTAGERLGAPSVHEGRFYDCRVSAGRERRTLNRPSADGFEPAEWVAPHPNGRLLAMSTAGGVAFVDLATGRTVATAPCGLPARLQFDARGGMWTYRANELDVPLLRWPVTADPADPRRLTVGPPEAVGTLVGGDIYSPSADGRVVALPRRRELGTLVKRPGPPAEVRTFGPHFDVRTTLLSPDGQRLATTSFHADDGSDIKMKVWDVSTGRHVASVPVGQADDATGFSPDGRWMYTSGGVAPTYRRWDLATVGADMVPRREATPPRPPGGASPDGRIVARVPDVNGIALHDATDDRELVRLPLLGGYARWCWSADGSRLFVVGKEGKKLYAYDLRLIRRGLAELGLDWDHPPYPPAPAWENDPFAPPLEVRVLGTDAVASPKHLAAAERTRAAADLAVNPLDPDAHYRLGRWMLDAGRATDAYPHLVAAVALNPRQTAALLPLAEAAVKTGHWATAADAVARAVEADPRNGRAHHLLGLSEAARRRHPEAVRAYTAALGLMPNDLAVLLDRADARRAAGDTSGAEADVHQADAVIAHSPQPVNNLAWEMVTGPPGLRNPKRALELAGKAIACHPNYTTLLNTLGVVQYRNGLYKEAVITLKKSLAAGKGESDAFDLFFLAMCHHRLGDPVEARQRFEAAVRWTEQAKSLTDRDRTELAEFRQETEAELAKPR